MLKAKLKLEYDKIHHSFICKQIYTVAIKNKYETFEQVRNLKWKTLLKSLLATIKFIPIKILYLMKKTDNIQ